MASATCTTTSVRRMVRTPRPLVPPRPPSRRIEVRLTGKPPISGTAPSTIPIAAAIDSVYATITASRLISAARGSSSRFRPPSRRSDASPIRSPAAAATIVNRRCSSTSWRAIRQRLAPSAIRVASSFSLARDRTNTRLATFTQPINNTNRAPPHNRYKVERTSRTRSSCSSVATE